MTITITAPPEPIVWGEPAATVYAAPAPTGAVPGVWTAGIYLRDGTKVADLDIANIGTIHRRRNEWPTVDFQVPRTETATLAHCKRWLREIHVYRNGRLMFVGPITGRKRSGSTAFRAFTASGVLRYLDKRRRDSVYPPQVNFFRNFRFDDGLAGWSGRSPAGVPSPTTATLDGDSETGTQSASLEAGQSISQPLLFTEFHVNFTLRIAARIKVDSACDPGTFITADVPGVGATAGYTSIDVTASTPRDVWTTIETSIAIDGTTQPTVVVNPSFHGLDGGTVLVDRCEANIVGLADLLKDQYHLDVLPESTGPQLDMGRIVANVVQGANADLNLGVDAPFTGQLMADDQGTPQIRWEIIKKMVDVEAFDIDVEASRYVRTLTIYQPRKGRDVPAEEVTLTPNEVDGVRPNCVDYDDDEDSVGVANDIAATGDDGHVGRALDLTDWEGFPLQDVRPAPSGLTDDQLNGWALTQLVKDPGSAESSRLVGIDGALLDVLDWGDRVHVFVDDCDTQVDEPRWLLDMDIDPASDTWDALVNKVPAEW